MSSLTSGKNIEEIPLPLRYNPEHFELVTRSCLLNSFLLREIDDFYY